MEKRYLLNTLDFLLLFWGLQLILGASSTAYSSSLGPISSIIKLPENENVILVEKKSQTLFLYTLEAKKDLHLRLKASCSTGEAYGVKKEAGDRKTPEGVYFLKNEYEDKYLSEIYGIKAFPTDYPNLMDKRVGKNGSAIWIHGTNKKLKPMDSNGCVALENENIQKLSDYVNLNSTPVIIVEEIETSKKKVLVDQEKEISHLLSQWIRTIEKGSYHAYLSFYSPEYVPDISWWEQWLNIRKQTEKTDSSLKASIERAGIYYHNNVFVVLFDFLLIAQNERVFIGKRKLFLENQNDHFKIVGDIFQNISPKFEKAKAPFITAVRTLVGPTNKESFVLETIHQWIAAWSTKDMDKYASFYADNFYSDGKNKKQWVRKKKGLANKYDFINVSGKDYKIKKKKNTCEVLFFQEYESSGLTTNGTKRLKLVKKGGLWKIYQESWKEK
ncbi:MAG: murein L,D-transpeptidase [Desulfobacteraceae bacterium]|nr:murein L,D-transpeptidase [Desulfobacteraceae bacterium]